MSKGPEVYIQQSVDQSPVSKGIYDELSSRLTQDLIESLTTEVILIKKSPTHMEKELLKELHSKYYDKVKSQLGTDSEAGQIFKYLENWKMPGSYADRDRDRDYRGPQIVNDALGYAKRAAIEARSRIERFFSKES